MNATFSRVTVSLNDPSERFPSSVGRRTVSSTSRRFVIAVVIVSTLCSRAPSARAESVLLVGGLAILGGWLLDQGITAIYDKLVDAPDRWEMQRQLNALVTRSEFEKRELARIRMAVNDERQTYGQLYEAVLASLQRLASRVSAVEAQLADLQRELAELKKRTSEIELRSKPTWDSEAVKHARRAFNALEANQFDQAIDSFEKAISFNSSVLRYHHGLALALTAVGRREEAEREWAYSKDTEASGGPGRISRDRDSIVPQSNSSSRRRSPSATDSPYSRTVPKHTYGFGGVPEKRIATANAGAPVPRDPSRFKQQSGSSSRHVAARQR